MAEGSELAPSPEALRLRAASSTARESLARLLVRAHELIHVERPHLEALYQSKLGAWALARLVAQHQVERLRRRLELAQAALNMARVPDWSAIERQLAAEDVAWQARIGTARAEIERAHARLAASETASASDFIALRSTFRALVLRLHPDLHPEADPRLFEQAVAAYESGDLEALRDIAAGVPPSPGSIAAEPSEEALAAVQARITAKQAEIDRIEASPPFDLRARLTDPAWVEAERVKLDTETATLRARAAALIERLEFLGLDGAGAGHGKRTIDH